ncbi:F-box domain-containing protein [Heracleum sosnowskyi]|uniref:F-box domain-containing protein n=1 Tax=Heracleum sosnowskyi TaxID=360622 RepID=A0AAD8GMC7_9APIA|nr:F-box domain-containing protein [Heracleum sosnowskyi]
MALSLQRYTGSSETHPLTQLLKQRIKKQKERLMLISLEKIDHLPENLIIEILSWLSVKDVLQFKSVCKSWEFKMLPEIICKPDLPSQFTYALYEVYGFGFDHVSGDYKVVVMKGYWKANHVLKHPVSVFVYSLSTDSWRYCGDLAKAYDLEINKCYIYVNECCYWFGSLDYSSEVIITFNMANDSFKEIDVPDYAQPSSKSLAVYDDSLAFLSLHETQKNLDIWTWSEGCWTKKFTVGPLPYVWSPVGHWKGNMLLLQYNDGKMVLFDPDTQETKDLAFQNKTLCQGVFAYMESLVSIKDKNKAAQQPEEKLNH